jgi:uncharacterized glyoxalase superfamily protein PhnB
MLGLDVSVDRTSDRQVSAARPMLVDHCCPLTVMPKAAHQVTQRSPAGRGKGIAERARDWQSGGTVRHGELLTGRGGVIMLGSPGAGFRGPAKLGEVTQLQCITITDLAAHRERARAAGAEVSEISMRANRAHSYTVDDPEGHRWYFSEPL